MPPTVQSGRFQQGFDAGLSDHAAIADQNYMREVKAPFKLLDLCRPRRRIGSVALKDFDRHRTAVAGAQQTEDDLQLVALAIAVETASCQRTGAALVGRDGPR
jgi:hypothetical protein